MRYSVLNGFPLLLLILLLSSGNISAKTYKDSSAYSDSSCCQQDYSCGDPLNCGSFFVEGRIGLAPTIWTQRQNFSSNTSPCASGSAIGLLGLPRFHNLFKTPWIIGGRVGYELSDNIEVYAEVNYRQAGSKTFIADDLLISSIAMPNFTLNLQGRYRAIDAYAGVRWYSDRWCDRAAFFVGGQFGFVHHKKVNFTFTSATTNVFIPTGSFAVTGLPLFVSNTAPAGGANLGIDVCIGCDLSFVITGEVIATCGPKANTNLAFCACTNAIDINPVLVPANLIIGTTGTEIFFPVTIGLKYSF